MTIQTGVVRASATCADLLVALPHRVGSALVLPGAEAWQGPLVDAGISFGARSPDLVVAGAGRAADAVATGARSAILLGGSGDAKLRRAGFTASRFLPIPSVAEPAVVVPLDRPRAARYALTQLSVPKGLLKTARNQLLARLIRLEFPLPGTVLVASRSPRPPYLVEAAGLEVGLGEELDWVLTIGRGAERSCFHLFEPRSAVPSWILKFGRSHHVAEQFLAEARGFDVIAEAGEVLARHAPRLLGTSIDHDPPFSIESAALGAPLVYVLRAPGTAARKLATVERVVRWLVEVAAATARPGGGAQALRRTIMDVAESPGRVDVESLVRAAGPIPIVAEHGDLDPAHILVHGDSFIAIDWELARHDGLPLADLAVFLSQALPILDGELDDPRIGPKEAFARLFRGEAPSSRFLFARLREACDACGLAYEAVGPVLSLAWLRHATDSTRHLVEVWFGDPALGARWPAWARSMGLEGA